MEKNPSMPESEAFAIATQQSHATGHSPKGYGTAEGRHEAKAKYTTPKDDVQTADPEGKTKSAFDVVFLAGLADELEKISGVMEWIAGKARPHVAAGVKEQFEKELLPQVGPAVEKHIKDRALGVLSKNKIPLALGGVALAGMGTAAYLKHKRNQRETDRRLARLEMLQGLGSQIPTESYEKLAGVFLGDGQIRKLANLSGSQNSSSTPGSPATLGSIKSTMPNKPLSGKSPNQSKVNATPAASPLANHQPTSEPPAVRR